ncbi:MAG: HlyD family efflux transporter periplasmic adaptor subunit [Clostridiales bacterium]|jgi:HlyD family secretion protein|nr:HlyD family efflux transporter periplasmic adaptor subunit [Clostridiales bacterium]
MKKTGKIIMGILFAAISIFSFFYYINLPIACEIALVKRDAAHMFFIEDGVVTSENEVNVFSTIPGKIINIYFDEGDAVKKGDVLLEIDSENIQNEIDGIKNNIKALLYQKDNLKLEEKKSKDSLKIDRDNLLEEIHVWETKESLSNITKYEQIKVQETVIAQNKKDIDYLQDQYDKVLILYIQGALSKDEFEKAEHQLTLAKSGLATNSQQLDLLKNTYPEGDPEYFTSVKDSVQARIDAIDNMLESSYISAMENYFSQLIAIDDLKIKSLEKSLDDSIIKSPIDGTVKNIDAQKTNVISTETCAATIISDNSYIESFILTKDAPYLKTGHEVELILKLRSEDITFDGVIIDISSYAYQKQSALGVEESKVKVKITLKNNDENIRLFDGMKLDVKYTEFKIDNQLLIPKTAVFSYDNKDFVWAVRDKKLQLQEVKKGISTRTDVVIESGLETGESVIKDVNIKGLKQGKSVKGV